MEPATTPVARDLKLVYPHNVRSKVTVGSPTMLGPRVFELTGLLQTTLDIEQQIELFYREVRRSVALDGLTYEGPEGRIQLTTGTLATHRATYDLVIDDEPLGILSLERETPFLDRELHVLENLLCALVYPLRNALSYRRAVEMALRDPLTGVANRSAFVQALAREVELARRQTTPLSLLVLDIDHFKRCNDRFGHSFGDDVLRAVAATAAATIRRCDLLFRYGGEEFVVLASHTSSEGALQLAERIRRNVETLETIGGRELALTISLGVASLRSEEDGKGLFDRADQALYAAKTGGRNRAALA